DEDVIAAIARVTGCSLAHADVLRSRIIEAGDSAAALASGRDMLTRDALAQGLPPAEVDVVWRALQRFAAYSFAKAHAVSYARMAWQCAYLRTHRPALFACAVLRHYGGAYPLRAIAADFARSGVRILAPS